MKAIFSLCVAAILLSACGTESNKNGSVSNATEINTSSDRPVNPPHGMPGHSCDVPDGAPLPEVSIQNGSPVQTEVQNIPVDANNGLKINPAHGMPGHRCDIAVGAPI